MTTWLLVGFLCFWIGAATAAVVIAIAALSALVVVAHAAQAKAPSSDPASGARIPWTPGGGTHVRVGKGDRETILTDGQLAEIIERGLREGRISPADVAPRTYTVDLKKY